MIDSRSMALLAFAVFALSAAQAAEVAVDVGHSQADSGAISARGVAEFDFNRALAKRVAQALDERGLAVRRINFDGRIGSLQERPQQARGVDFFLSIHHDSLPAEQLDEWQWGGATLAYSDRYRGFALFVSRENADLAASLRCASSIGARLRRLGFTAATHHAESFPGHTPREPADAENAVYYYDALSVLRRNRAPAVLFEAGLIKHRDEELELRDSERRQRMAEALASGVAACLATR